MKVVSLSSRGQLVIPAAILRAMGIKGKTDLAVVQDGKRLVITRASDVGKKVVDDLEGFEELGWQTLEKLWDNPEDEEAFRDL